MVCKHLKELYQFCEEKQLKLAGPELIHIVCKQCDEEETCPSMLMEQYDSKYPDDEDETNSQAAADQST